MFVVVAYDIANDRRLKRTAALMERYGVRVQRSVFECELTPQRIDMMIAELKATLNRRLDKVRVYRLCRTCQSQVGVCGRDLAPESLDVFVL